MNGIPKELTVELLSLITDKKVDVFKIENNYLIYRFYVCKDVKESDELNLDTLTRLMKEWCFEQGYDFTSSSKGNESKHYNGLCMLHNDVNRDYTDGFSGYSEFEAVLTATHWVAKERGLLK